MIEEIILTCSFSVFCLLMWFNTDAFAEYAKLFGGKKFFAIDVYEEQRNKSMDMDYPRFLSIHKEESFFIKLISCQMCALVWLCVLFSLIFMDNLILVPLCYLISLASYKITVYLSEFC